MEVVIILIILGIIGYLIYQSLPNTKFEKAQNLFNAKDYVQAINILNEIFEKHADAPAKLAECKLNLGKQTSAKSDKLKFFNDVVEIRKRISNSLSIARFDNIEVKALFEIAKIQYEESKADIEKLNQNLKFIDNANKKGLETDFNTLRTKHFNQLSESYFRKAIGHEKSNKYQDAIQVYKKAIECSEKSSNSTTKHNAVVRISICRLKLNESIDLHENSEVQKSDKEYQKDLFYRYSVYLLKKGDFQQAENIISTHLNFKSPDIEKLRDVLKAEKVNIALNQITQINQKIEQLYNNSLSTEELSTFYNSLESIVSSLKTVDLELSEKVLAIKPTLFNRLLTNYISIEQYENAINLIQKYPKFWESPELLKNLGICCYCYTSKGLLTDKNYKIVISGWLTSVYSDKVILKSLEDTSWDDNYTFSLAESIGSNYSQHEEVPENVNYDEVSENNISIGSTQRELLQQFETIIHKEIKDTQLSILVNDFYDKEKNALEKVVNILATDILFPTPHFAISNGLNNEIIKELDSDYEEYSNEEALEAGVPYIKNSTSSIVYQYFFANDIVNKIKSAIVGENSATIKKLNTKENKGWLEKFDNISTTVEDSLFNTIANKISEDDENEALIAVMEECIAFLSNNEKLKHQYSNYVASYCISQVNEDNIDNFKALSLMKGAYLRSPNNPRICKNFITLIRYNLMDILNDRTKKTTDIYKILDWVKNNMSQTYKQNSNELSNARKEILGQLKSNGVDISLFEDNGLASILSGHSLNSQGIQMKKVLTYLSDLGSVQETTNPLDKLRQLRQQLNLDDDLPF
jgi:tetratricopeptide (TPR) repeat protein